MTHFRRLGARVGSIRAPRVRSGPGFGLRIGRAGASADYHAGTNELPVQVALVDVLAPGGVFLDVGANVGFFALIASRIVGDGGHVIAIEPVPANAQRIRANARSNHLGNLTVMELAASDTSGTATLLLAKHPGGAVIATAGAPPDRIGAIDVRSDTVDRLVESGEIPPPTVLKIDVEGAEAAVLAGMAVTLRDLRPVVLCELDAAGPVALAAKQEGIGTVLTEAGYRVEELEPSYAGSEWLVTHLLARPMPEVAA